LSVFQCFSCAAQEAMVVAVVMVAVIVTKKPIKEY
jgi:hypothetical protein